MKIFKRIRLCALSIMLILCMLLPTASLAVFAEGADAAAATGGDDAVSNDAAASDSATEDEDMVDVVMLVNDVAASRKVKKADVVVKKFKDVNLPKNIISDPNKVIGKYAKRKLYAGEYVSADQLSDKSTTQSSSDILTQAISKSKEGFVDVTDYFPPNTGEDVTTHIQKLIDTNVARTLYFPDGEYIITRPIKTCGGAAFTVSLWLSDGAVIKADPEKWRAESTDITAMICLGKKDREEPQNNDVISTGSYYSLQGGTIDGSGVAKTLSLGGGRETLIKNVVLKNTPCGIEIPTGTNNVSSDMDVDDVTIVGNGEAGSVGINILGYDNTFSNIRIYNVEVGINAASGGHALRDIRIYNTSNKIDYSSTRGIVESTGSNNFIYHCYVQDCAIAFALHGGSNTIDSCTARWTKAQGTQKMFSNRNVGARISLCRAQYFGSAGTYGIGSSYYDYKIEQTN